MQYSICLVNKYERNEPSDSAESEGDYEGDTSTIFNTYGTGDISFNQTHDAQNKGVGEN